MPESPADETAVQLDALHSHLVDFSAEVMAPGETSAVGHINVTIPGWLVRRAWNELRTAARQLRSLAGLNRALTDRVSELESTSGAQQVELSSLRGTESDRLEALSRWAVEFAAQHGVEPSTLPMLVQSQRTHDSALWARLDGERMALEQYRLAVHSITEQIRDANGERDGLDGRGVKVVLTALRRAYRGSRA